MDLTALELGLRNRHLLQVKCFLKIQVETFRYFLTEELPRLKTADERISSLDKFFTHDWQNVINKIVSVAVVNMTGDYTSMMLAVSLFRSVIQSSTQLLRIISSINQSDLDSLLLLQVSEEPARFILSRSSSSTTTSSNDSSQPQSDSNTIKMKIFSILQRQICSIKSHLERVYNVNIGADCKSSADISLLTQSHRLPSRLSEQNSPSALSLSAIDQWAVDDNLSSTVKSYFDQVNADPQATFRASLEMSIDKIALLQCMYKKYCPDTANDKRVAHRWEHVVETVIEIVSSQLKTSEISLNLMDRVDGILSQTGLPSLSLLFSIFYQTCDAKLRQKLLQAFFIRYADVPTLEAAIEGERFIEAHDGAPEKVDFVKYLQILSIIDLYAFCYRPKLDEAEHMELSLDWILNTEHSQFSLVKSLVLPSLEEILIHPELFANWRTLNQQIYNDLWNVLSVHFVGQQDFSTMLSAEVLWQYWVDRNKVKLIVAWVENGYTTLPYCPAIIVPPDLPMCQRMLKYFCSHGSFLLRKMVMQSLCTHQTFFGGYSFYQLDAAEFAFQSMLGYAGQCDHVFGSEYEHQPDLLSCFRPDDQQTALPGPHLPLSMLIDYCLSNELYEFLYLIYNRFQNQLEPIICAELQSDTSAYSNKKVLILQLLCHFNEGANVLDPDFIFSKSLPAMKYLCASSGVSSKEEDSLSCIVQHLIEQRQDIDLALLMLAFSHQITFDQLANRIQRLRHNDSHLMSTFSKLLHSKYPLIWRAFEPGLCGEPPTQNLLAPPLRASTPEQPSPPSCVEPYRGNDARTSLTSGTVIDLYTLLQQAVPYVNIDKFFRWQIKRRVQRLRYNSSLDESIDSNDLALSGTRKTSTNCENDELPNFSQNRLSELYGLKAELTSSYYLKNGRLLQSFFKCFNLKSSHKSARARDQTINQKMAIKATRKAALIAYSSIQQNSVFACCLLFQSLVKAGLGSSSRSEAAHRKSAPGEESMANLHAAGSDTLSEFAKTRLHLALGKLIIEFAADCITVQSAQQQQVGLSILLRKSHFSSDRSSSQKLLNLAVTAIERKYSSSASSAAARRSFLGNRLHSLLLAAETTRIVDDSKRGGSRRGSTPVAATGLSEECSLLMECFEWKPLLLFADLYALKRPFNFLNKCAREDNWLVFSIFAQMYTISKDDIQTMLRQGIFNNHCIGEHLAKAFQSSSRLSGSTTLSVADSKLVKLKQAPNSSRNDFYSRLFKGKVASQSSETEANRSFGSNKQSVSDLPESDLLSTSANSNPETFSLSGLSVLSKLSDDSSVPLILYENALKPDMVNKDFLQLVLEIYQNCLHFGVRTNSSSYSFESTLRNTLLYTAVSLSNPVLALLACSLERPPITPVISIVKSPSESTYSRAHSVELSTSANSQFKFNCFMCWLLSSAQFKSKQLFIDSYLYSSGNPNKKADLAQCYLDWNEHRSLHLIEVLTQHDTRVFVTLTEGLGIFDLDIPILSKLLQFLIQFFIEKDYYQADTLLIEFKSLLQSYNEQEFMLTKNVPPTDYENFETVDDEFVSNQGSLRIFYSKNWIEKCCLILVTNSLLLSQQFELGILLSHFNFVRLQESFSPNLRIPDIRNLYFFSQCLAKLPNFSLPIAELLRHGPTLSDTGNNGDYTEYVSIFRRLIFDLQEAGHFEEARNIINLLPKANVNEFIINEWMLKAKKANNNSSEANFLESDEVTLDSMDLHFWETCWAQVTKLDPSMHSAFKVMERFVQHLQPNQLLIKCFVLLKCMLAIESILRDFIETSQSESTEEWSENSFFDDLATNNLDLVQDYFQFEYSLWTSAVECEHLILHKTKSKSSSEKKNGSSSEMDTNDRTSFTDSFEDQIVNAWRLIWRDIINYIKFSSFSNYIIPKLSLKHTFFYKNINSKRNKHVINLEGSRQQALNQVIGKLLDSLCLQKAKEVSTLFRYSHDDFEIIEACDNAAKGTVKNASDASFAIQFKIQNLDSASTSKFTTNSHYSLFPSQNLTAQQKQTISLIATFTNFASIGKKTCNLILLYYKIACILRVPYAELMNSNYSSVKVFQLLLSSSQGEDTEWRNRANSHETIELSSSFDSRSQVESVRDNVDPDNNLNSLDTNSGHSALVNQYQEAIACAKELIRIVGEQDEQLNSEEKIAVLLANHTMHNVQQLVDRQFKDSLSSSTQTSPVIAKMVTEIELDKNQLSFFSARFLVLIKLLQAPSILGHTLIDICKKQKSAFEDLSPSDAHSEFEYALRKRKHFVLLVELYIRAHECFTAQCDVHGIALVLRRTRLLITQELHAARYFHLILRLLTGIGRYSEMTYCFDLFRECDRFELILSKRVQRTPQLRIALLNYLKTINKVDELLPLVAIRFFLFRETADYHRSRAERLLSEICAKEAAQSGTSMLTQSHSYAKFSSSPATTLSYHKRVSSHSLGDYSPHSPSTTAFPTLSNKSMAPNGSLTSLRDQLEALMYEFQEAESNYTKASSHTNAEYCSRMSQLVALQIAFINRATASTERASSATLTSNSLSAAPSVTQNIPLIISMDAGQVREFIFQCNNFFEALIVSKAYTEVNTDWTDPFFYNVILNSNMTYLNDFADTFPISMTLVKKLIKRFDQLATATKQQNRAYVKDSYNLHQQSSSPSSASFNSLLSQVRSDSDLQRARRVLEPLLERVLMTPTSNLKDRYKLTAQFNSTRLMQRLMDVDTENAYLLDLKHLNKL